MPRKQNGAPPKGKVNQDIVTVMGAYHHRSWIHIDMLAVDMNKKKGPLEKRVLSLCDDGYVEDNPNGQSEYRLTQQGRDAAKQL